MVKLQLNL